MKWILRKNEMLEKNKYIIELIIYLLYFKINEDVSKGNFV